MLILAGYERFLLKQPFVKREIFVLEKNVNVFLLVSYHCLDFIRTPEDYYERKALDRLSMRTGVGFPFIDLYLRTPVWVLLCERHFSFDIPSPSLIKLILMGVLCLHLYKFN